MTKFLEEEQDTLEKRDVPKLFNNKLNEGTVSYLVRTNQIPYWRVGKRKVLFSKKRLQQWIRERENVELRYNTK